MWEKATELQSLEPSRDWTCLPSEQSTNNNRPSWSRRVCGHLTAVPRFRCHVHSWNKEGRETKFVSVKLKPSAGSMPTLIFPPPVAKSVGTAFRASSGGGRLTLTYRPALATHILVPDVATCQMHSLFKNGTYWCNKPIYIFLLTRTETI